MTDPKHIQFPGTAERRLEEVDMASKNKVLSSIPAPKPAPQGWPGGQLVGVQLSPDQQKALNQILSGQTFILIAIRPTETGADFITALHGDKTDLRNAQDSLPGVIDRLFARKGVTDG